MKPRTNRVKGLTAVAAVVTVVAIVMFILFVFALASLAPVINQLPALILVILVGLAFTLSAIALWQALRAPRQISAALVNIALIVSQVGMASVIFYPWFVRVNETVILPQGFMGTVLIVYKVPIGSLLEHDSSGAITYRIPSNGLLLIRDAAPEHTIYRRHYFFSQPDGSLVPIVAHWYTTIHETDPDFRASIIGTYLEGSGAVTPAGGCKIHYEHFVIGTKQSIRSGPFVTEQEMLRSANLMKC